MKSPIRALAITLIALALGACAPAEEMADPAEDMAAIEAVRVAEGEAGAAGDVEAFLALLTDDVITMPPNAPLIMGKAAAKEWLEGFVAQYTVVMDSYTTDEIEVSGDLAFERYTGAWTLTSKATGESMSETMKGIHVYRKQADGSWKIARDTWNTSDPLPEM